jgi:hypothetical protein
MNGSKCGSAENATTSGGEKIPVKILVCCALRGHCFMRGITGHASVIRLRFTFTKALYLIHRPTPKNIRHLFQSDAVCRPLSVRYIDIDYQCLYSSTTRSTGPLKKPPPPPGGHSLRLQGPFAPLISPHRAPRGFFLLFAGLVKITRKGQFLGGKSHFWPHCRGGWGGLKNLF